MNNKNRSHVQIFLHSILIATHRGEIVWQRSTEDQVFSDVDGKRIVITLKRIFGSATQLILPNAKHLSIDLSVFDVNPSLEKKSIFISSSRFPIHEKKIEQIWRYAQEYADAPIKLIEEFLEKINEPEAIKKIEESIMDLINEEY